MQPLARKPAQISTSIAVTAQSSSSLKDKRKDLPASLALHGSSFQKQGKPSSSLFSPIPAKSRHSPQGSRIFDNDSPGPPVILLEGIAAFS